MIEKRICHSVKAVSLFVDGCNCAQATASAFADVVDVSEAEIKRNTAGFGGGMGGRREQCGAVSAMVYLAGAMKGEYDPKDNAAKRDFYSLVRGMIDEFSRRFGTVNCRELLTRASCEVKTDPSERTHEYYNKRPCARFVEAAADIVESHLLADNAEASEK